MDNYSIFRKTMQEDWYKKNVNPNVGVWVGADIENQHALVCKNITKEDINEDFDGLIYVSNGNSYGVLRGIGANSEEDS